MLVYTPKTIRHDNNIYENWYKTTNIYDLCLSFVFCMSIYGYMCHIAVIGITHLNV